MWAMAVAVPSSPNPAPPPPGKTADMILRGTNSAPVASQYEIYIDSIRASSPRDCLNRPDTHDCNRLLCGTLNFLLPGGGHPHMAPSISTP
jgi:hypothetical protein